MSRSDRLIIAGVGATVVVAVAIGWLLLTPGSSSPNPGVALASQPVVGSSAPQPHAGGEIVVDVEGAVVQPGVHALPAGSRVADALAAAGGYSTRVDLAAAAQTLNLARAVADGEQIRVPAIGENAAPASAAPGESAATGGGGGGGPLNLNTATPEELEALPGIGPVTVQKIVAARQEQPFASLEDAVTRGVIDRGQLEDITGLATAG